MKKIIPILALIAILLVGCNNVQDPINSIDPSNTVEYVNLQMQDLPKRDGDMLYVNIEGVIHIYQKEPSRPDLTAKDTLGHFMTSNHIEGIYWEIYSAVEYPDLSYVITQSATRLYLVFRLVGTQPIEGVKLDDLSAFIASQGFNKSMSQSELFQKMEKYSYNGQNIHDGGYFYDGPYGGGYSADGQYTSLTNDYYADESSSKYTNRLITKVALDGLTLPCGITFDDTVFSVLKKINLRCDPILDFYADAGSVDIMTLVSSDNSKLYVEDCSRKPTKPSEYINLIYQETYTSSNNTTITCSIKFSFPKALSVQSTIQSFCMETIEFTELK